MKKPIIFMLFTFLISITTYGQDYFPLIEENKTWNVLSVALIPLFDTSFSTITYKFSGDTIINSDSYKKLYLSFQENPEDWSLWGFMREDADKRVWLRMDSEEDEFLMYDYSIDVGDSVFVGIYEPVYLLLDSISEITINQTERKKYWFSCNMMPEYRETWIEGIGSNKGICWSGSAFVVGGWYRLLCMSENGELMYMNPNYESCYLKTDINEIEKSSLKVFPNPAKNTLIIENKENVKIKSISLLNVKGQIIKQFEINNTQLDISNISSGYYILKISHENGVFTQKLIVK